VAGAAALTRGVRCLAVALAVLAAPEGAAQGLVAEGACRDGEPNGGYTLRAPDGRLRVAGAFARGQRTGTFLFWSERGDRIAVVPYDNGRKAGTIAVWYEPPSPGADAPRKSEAAYADGVLHGEKRSWHPSGRLRAWLRYERGALVEARAWAASGAALSDAEARAQASRDAATDEAFYATLEALVAGRLPKCETST
jgi:antitoxin component YwqK of YwqJK toxin-antitoxin module